MRLRMGLIIGFGAGYYLGARAGRERYDQIHDMAAKLKRTETFEVAAEKARSVVDLGVERAKDLVDASTSNGHGSEPGSETHFPSNPDR